MPQLSTTPARPFRVCHHAVEDQFLLARVCHGTSPTRGDDPRLVQVPLPVLTGPAEENWLSPTPVQHGWSEGLGYAENGAVLFGQLQVAEPELQRLGLARATFHAYGRVEHLLRSRGYPHWLRTWNYLAEITRGEGDEERYRQFSLGRHNALALKPGFEQQLPAATAIGTAEGGLVLYFLAARAPGRQIENPRQTSAYAYPRQYGPKSPSFSRATLVDWADGAELLISGTASVVGHETRHVGDVPAQMQEALANIDSLLGEAERRLDAESGRLRAESLRLYVRDPEHAAAAMALCRERHPDTPLSALLGDICRSELLLEVEGSYRVRP